MNDEDDDSLSLNAEDEPLIAPVLSFNSHGESQIEYPKSGGNGGRHGVQNAGLLVPPTLNWAQIREEEKQVDAVRNARRIGQSHSRVEREPVANGDSDGLGLPTLNWAAIRAQEAEERRIRELNYPPGEMFVVAEEEAPEE